MKNIILSVLAGWLLPGIGHAECSYSFDAHATQLAMYSLLKEGNTTMIKPLISNAQQQVSAVLPDVPQKYMAFSYNGVESLIQHASNSKARIGDLSIAKQGVLALELTLDHLTTAVTTPDNHYHVGLALYGSSRQWAGNNGLLAQVRLSTGAMQQHLQNVLEVVAAGATSYQHALDMPVPAGYRLGLYLDQDQGRLGLIINGADQGYISDQLPRHIDRLSLVPFVFTDLEPANPQVGERIAASIITDAGQMQFHYPKGTQDICGNAVPAP